MTARPKGGRRAALILGPVGRAFRAAANEAVAGGRPCPFCGAVAVDAVSREPVDVPGLRPGTFTAAVEHESYCPAGAT